MTEILEAKRMAEEYQRLYSELVGSRQSFSCLVMGLFGAGKTTFACTGRLPILVDTFDPNGTIIFQTDPFLRDLVQKGALVTRTFWNESTHSPTEYQKWEKIWQDDCKSGFIGRFGTYCIDSGTTQLEAITNYIAYKKGRGDNLQIQDYPIIYNIIRDIVKISSSQGADFIYTGHLVDARNDLTSEVMAELDTYQRLKSRLPLLFTEKYVIMEKQTSKGVEHILLTEPRGRFRASTQLGAKGIFKAEEVPNIKELLKKAGMQSEDKPLPKEWK